MLMTLLSHIHRMYDLQVIYWNKYTGQKLTYKEASRDSFATQLADNGADAYEIKAALRHTDIRVSQKYVHKGFERLRDKINSRDKVKVLI